MIGDGERCRDEEAHTIRDQMNTAPRSFSPALGLVLRR